MRCADFWPWFFGIDAGLIFVWAFFRFREWGIEGERWRGQTMGVAILFACLAGLSNLLAHARLEWVP